MSNFSAIELISHITNRSLPLTRMSVTPTVDGGKVIVSFDDAFYEITVTPRPDLDLCPVCDGEGTHFPNPRGAEQTCSECGGTRTTRKE